jgi:hypothetical protein
MKASGNEISMKALTLVVLSCLLALSRAHLVQASEIQEVAPEGLSLLIRDRDATVAMIDGGRIEGRVIMCNEIETRMRVKRSEPKGRITTEETSVRNQEISTVQITKHGPRAILGGVIGALGGWIIGVLLVQGAETDALILVPVATTTGGAILGARLGRKVTTIHVKKSSAKSP